MKKSLAFLGISLFLSILFGYGSDPSWLWDAIQGEINENVSEIILSIRLPRIACVLFSGMALSAAGVVSQGIFRNTLASPSLLGVDSAAVLGGSIVISFLPTLFLPLGIPMAASLGASLVTGLVILIQRRKFRSTGDLLLIGFALTTMLGGLTSLILNLTSSVPMKTQMILQWLMGGFSNGSWPQAFYIGGAVLFSCLILFPISSKLDALTLGNEVAQTLGIDINRIRTFAVLICGLLIGAVTSAAGAIPFVGLVIPHISRIIHGPMHRPLLLGSMMNGATFLLLTDLLARTIIGPEELQMGVVTTLIGSPFFLWLLVKRKQTYA
jgi:iron complex transport system permease protein